MGRRLTVLAVFGCMTAIMAALPVGASGAAHAAEDRKPPTVASVSPAADSTTPDATPEISAKVTDRQTNLAKKNIRLFVDGVGTTTFSYDRATDRLSHTPEGSLAEGGHTVRIVATDIAGNVSRKAWTFSVDTPPDTGTPPDTAIDSGPEGTVANDSASFSFSSAKAGLTFECSLDGSTFAGCASPQGYTGLSQGGHTFGVRAVDGAGNVDATPATRTWTVDTIGPDASITGGPPSPSDSRSASFAFTGAEAGGGYQCKIDGAGSTGTFSACTSGDGFTVDADGTYTFSVRASDALGNFGTSANRTWAVDTTPDSVTVTPNPLDFTPGASACNMTITKTVTITNNTASQVDLFPSVTRTSYSVASNELHIASGGSVELAVSWSTSGGFKFRDAGTLELKDAGGSTIATGDLTAFVFCPIEG